MDVTGHPCERSRPAVAHALRHHATDRTSQHSADVVLLRPSHRTGSLFLKKLGFLPVPIGLLQLAGELRKECGNNVSVIDMEADDKTVDEVVEELLQRVPDIVGVTLHATAAHNTAVEIARRTKEAMEGVMFIAGGHHATFMAEELIRGGFDVIVLGEGDGTIGEIAQAVRKGEGLSNIKGIVYEDNGIVRRTPGRELIRHLDDLAMPALDLVDPSRYGLDTFGTGESVICLETSRGCPYACEFCSVTPVWGNRWRSKSNQRIIQELELAKKLGYSWVFFTDDVFFAEPVVGERKKLFDEIIRRGIGIKWIAQTRPDAVVRHPALIELAAEAGMRMAAIGVESGNQETLRRMRKGMKPPTSKKAVEILDRNGILTLCSIMIGAPYESLQDMVKTVRFGSMLVNAGADLVQFTVYTPFPGTGIFHEAVRKGTLITTDWERFDILTPVMVTKVSPALIQLLQNFGVYYFQMKSYLRFKLKKQGMSTEKAALLESATGYVLKKLRLYLADIAALPSRMNSTRKLFAAGRGRKMNEELVRELTASENLRIYSTAK